MKSFQIFKTKNGGYTFRVLGTNGAIVLSSDVYLTKEECMNSLKRVQIAAQEDSNFERTSHSNGYVSFTLKTHNGQILGRSEMYASMAGRENGIELVKRAFRNIGDNALSVTI